MTAHIASAEKSVAEGVSPSQLFVINLCASTSPMALSHPSSPELKRYTFFVSRQREEGRERFRLHMGYFASQEQAETLLEAVRDVYPAAWAGPAPSQGVGRRARPGIAVVPSAPAPAPAPVVAQIAPVAAAEPPAAPVVAAPVVEAPIAAPRAVPTSEPVAADPLTETLSNVRDVLALLSDDAPAPAPVAPAVVAPAVPVAAAPAAPVALAAPAATESTVVRTAAAVPPQPPRLQPVKTVTAPRAPVAAPTLSDSQTLRVLETGTSPTLANAAPARATPRVAEPAEADAEVRLVTPEDTQTLTDIRLDAQNNAPPCFAVQLVWSVSPIDVASLPHLAIFDAYTLYNVEGNRQGRKWYGLRLGFFSDPNSATQVAQYVRSDYGAVAVVPVAIKERDHARGGAVPAAGATPRLGASKPVLKPEARVATDREEMNGFELLADDTPAAVKRDLDDVQPAKAAAAVAAKPPAHVPKVMPVDTKRAAPPKAAGKPTGKRVVVRKRPEVHGRAAPGAPQPLESTLEILGASTLTLDESREIINDSAVRKPIPKKSAGGNRFSKLLSRLGGG